MIGKDLVKPQGEQLRNPGRPETPGGKIAKFSALGQRKRIAETEGHSDRRHGMVMPGRVAYEHPARTPVSDPGPQLIGRGVEPPRLQRFDKCRAESPRQQAGIGFRQKADPVAG